MRLGKYIPPWVTERLAALGLHAERHRPLHLSPAERDHGAQDPRRTSASIRTKGVYTHALYGNTASASVGVTYRQLLEERTVKRGDKLVLGSAAAGYSMVMATGEWTGSAS